MKDRSGEILDGRYELRSLLGEGGMGQVYEGKHVVTGRRVAVKFLLTELADNTEMIQRFYREAQAATAIGSEHICEVLDMSPPTEGESPYLVMEYLDGESLKDRLKRERRLSLVDTTNIMLQMLEALYAAHKAGIVHRDIKPENIFLVLRQDKPVLVKLLDFGISKFNPLGGDDDHSLTKTGTVLGTPYYMSPEQASGDRGVGPLSDLYATGVILYEALTGKVPFDAESFSALVVKIVTHTPPHPCDLNPELPRPIGDLVLRAMARNANERFQSAKEMAEALRSVASGQAIPIQTINAAEASFAAVALPGSGGGQQSVSMDGISPVLGPDSGSFATGSGSFATGSGSFATGSGSFSTSDPSIQTQTPMAMSRSVAGQAGGGRTWMIVGGIAGVLVMIGIAVAAVVIIPGLGDGGDSTAAVEPPPPPPPPQDLVPPQKAPPQEPPPAEQVPDPGQANPAATPDAGAAATGDAAPAEEEPTKIRVTLSAQPSEATIYLDDEPVEGNPAEVEVPADGATHRVRAEADGHRPGQEEFVANEDTEVAIVLYRRHRDRPSRPHQPSTDRPNSNRPGNTQRPVNPVSGVVNPWGD